MASRIMPAGNAKGLMDIFAERKTHRENLLKAAVVSSAGIVLSLAAFNNPESSSLFRWSSLTVLAFGVYNLAIDAIRAMRIETALRTRRRELADKEFVPMSFTQQPPATVESQDIGSLVQRQLDREKVPIGPRRAERAQELLAQYRR